PGARQTAPRTLAHRKALDWNATQADAPRIRTNNTADEIEKGRLPGTVWPDQPEHLARLKRQIDVVGDNNAAEAFAELFDAERVPHGPRSGVLRPDQMGGAAINPGGRANMKSSTSPENNRPCIGPSTLGGRPRNVMACGRICRTTAPRTGPHVL